MPMRCTCSMCASPSNPSLVFKGSRAARHSSQDQLIAFSRSPLLTLPTFEMLRRRSSNHWIRESPSSRTYTAKAMIYHVLTIAFGWRDSSWYVLSRANSWIELSTLTHCSSRHSLASPLQAPPRPRTHSAMCTSSTSSISRPCLAHFGGIPLPLFHRHALHRE